MRDPKDLLFVHREPPECLKCGANLTGITAARVSDKSPEPVDEAAALEGIDGNISICTYCANVAIFVVDGDHVRLRPPRRGEELDSIAADEDLQVLVAAIKANPLPHPDLRS